MHQAAISAWVQAIPQPALFISIERTIIDYNEPAKIIFNEGLKARNYTNALRQPTIVDAIETSFLQKSAETARIQVSKGLESATFEVNVAYIAAGISGVLVTLTDLSEIEQTTQLHRDFVANVSHELKTPLTAIAGFIETLQGPARADEQAQERFLGIMADETARMNRLVSDLLSLSRVEAQERQPPKQKLSLEPLLRATVAHVAPLAELYNAEIKLHAADGVPQVLGDEDQLRQVFGNLIENALRYGGEGVRVTIETSEIEKDLRLQSKAICVSVRDTGPGFDPVHIPRLTERFYRIDGHRSREKGGTGLGLAITKHIIARHKGRLKIKSTPSQGSEFTVILPVV